jgi:hypothetical protein
MDLLQIKLCKAVNSQLRKKCYYLSNDRISLAFSLLDDCPTINSINNTTLYYINYIKNNNQIEFQETKQSSHKYNIQQVGGSLLLKSKQNLLRLKKTKTNNKRIPINETSTILNSKISINYLKKIFIENQEFIKFLNILSKRSQKITYFDFFVFHFIFTIKV